VAFASPRLSAALVLWSLTEWRADEPSCRAASTLAWPAISPPSSPTSAGVVQPHFLDARGYRGDLRLRVRPCIFRIRDQPVDRPPFDLVGRPRSLISGAVSPSARAPRAGKCWRFYPPADPLQAALRLAPLIVSYD
jgi:hypothetical protein